MANSASGTQLTAEQSGAAKPAFSISSRKRTCTASSFTALPTRSRFSNQQTASRGTFVSFRSSNSSLASSSSDRQPQLLKAEPSEQDLSNISLDKFFPENFGKQLQNNQLQKNTFQQLRLEHPSFTEKILNKELAITFAKSSFIDNLVFQNFFFPTLALQKVASEQLGENNLYKKQLAESSFTQTAEEACKEQLLTTGFPEARLNQQPFSNSLVQQSGAKAASASHTAA